MAQEQADQPPSIEENFGILTREALSLEGRAALGGLQEAVTSLRQRLELAEKASVTDPLTGLYNRRAFDRDILEWYQELNRPRTQRKEDVISHHGLLLLGDADGFKQVNDTLGYDQGDKVLITFAKLLRSCVRRHDRIYRIGGDEFAIIAPVAIGDEGLAAQNITQRFHEILGVARNDVTVAPLERQALNTSGISFGSGVLRYGCSMEDIEQVKRDAMAKVKAAKERKGTPR